MKKKIFCPNCKTGLTCGQYSVKLNIGVICLHCKQIIFPSDEANQPKLKKETKETKVIGFGTGVGMHHHYGHTPLVEY